MRFLVQAPAIYHARDRGAPESHIPRHPPHPDRRARHADPFALSTIASPVATFGRCSVAVEPIAPVAVDVLRVKKARRWVWALATTKDYEHSPIESLVSVMHALAHAVRRRAAAHARARRCSSATPATRSCAASGASWPIAPSRPERARRGGRRRQEAPAGRGRGRRAGVVVVRPARDRATRPRAPRPPGRRSHPGDARRELPARQGDASAPQALRLALRPRSAAILPGAVERSPLERRGRIPVAPADAAPEGRSPAPHLRAGDRRDERDQPRPRPRGHARRARAGRDPPRATGATAGCCSEPPAQGRPRPSRRTSKPSQRTTSARW